MTDSSPSRDDRTAPTTTRRTLLTAGTTAAAAGFAGCLGIFETRPAGSGRDIPLVENRPKAVYVPTHVDDMGMIGMAQPGPYGAALTFSFPHRFWLVTGQDSEMVELNESDSAHVMLTLWDRETRMVVPNGNVRVEMTRDGESVVDKRMWPMLSQNMGFHFGDNVALPGDGTYEVDVSIGPMDARRTGGFQGKFGASTTASFTFEFAASKVEGLSYQRLEDRQGSRGAVDPMQMGDMPVSELPEASTMPGETLGTASSGDGVFVASRLDSPPAGVEGSGPYLAVSARTPYNRFPLPFMSLAATVEEGGETVFEDRLSPTFDPDLHYHYGVALDSLGDGASITLRFGAPPQVARHEGYETAFMDMPDVEIPNS